MTDGRPPAGLAALVAGRPADRLLGPEGVDGDAWLRRLPSLVDGLLAEWGLIPDGPAGHGVCALALPVLGAQHCPAVLKVTWPHVEAATEHLALRRWAGDGAVRLLRAEPARWALLLERLDATTDLGHVGDDRACEIVGSLLARLHVAPLPQVPRLAAYLARQRADLEVAATATHGPVPRRFVAQARTLVTDLATVAEADHRLLHTDLHYANVLAAGREPWLAIDPKPHSGDPAAEPAPLLWNRTDELGRGAQVRWVLRRRIEIVCETAGLDQTRARAWAIVRAVDNALERPDDPGWVSLMVQICKAMSG